MIGSWKLTEPPPEWFDGTPARALNVVAWAKRLDVREITLSAGLIALDSHKFEDVNEGGTYEAIRRALASLERDQISERESKRDWSGEASDAIRRMEKKRQNFPPDP